MQKDRNGGSIDKGTNPEINPERNRDRTGNPGADPGRGDRPGPDRARDRTVIESDDAESDALNDPNDLGTDRGRNP